MTTKTDSLTINQSNIPRSAFEILHHLESAGYETWFVGGFVRDSLMGRPCQDIDLATSAHWQDVSRVAAAAGFTVHETGTQHGTVTVVSPAPAHEAYEITTFRTDGSYKDGRHPDSVIFVKTINEDLARRDFTINAIAWHPDRGLFDPFNGEGDIHTQVIRVCGDPKQRFKEDALRILRAARFASQLGFEIELSTQDAMTRSKNLLHKISKERIAAEIDKLLLGPHAGHAIIQCSSALEFVLPELVAMKGFDQHTPYHIYDVLEHTAYVVDATQPTLLNRWAALCHDMGKPAACFYDATNDVNHFYGHANVSCELARPLLKRFLKSEKFIADVLTLVKHHDEVIEPTEKSVKRALRRLDGRVDLFEALCDLKQADARAQAPMCADRITLADELLQILNSIVEGKEPFALKDLAINGGDVIACGVNPGPQIGSILNNALDAVIEGAVTNNKSELIDYIKATNKL
jgi:tRNA nucleotidyltransferase (CCA-adding enzyme)